MTRLKTLFRISLDILYSQCDKELKLDFLKILDDCHEFNNSFNSENYIARYGEEFFIDPQGFIQEYQVKINSLVRHAVNEAQKITIQKKYVFFIYQNNNRYHNMYRKHYTLTFDKIDQELNNEQEKLNFFITTNLKEIHERERH